MSHHEKKLSKKLRQIFHNRHTQQINQQAEVHERNRELDREREEEARATAAASSRNAARKGAQALGESKSGNRQLDLIRETNSHRSRVAQDRWNRFAGTAGGGGRGL